MEEQARGRSSVRKGGMLMDDKERLRWNVATVVAFVLILVWLT